MTEKLSSEEVNLIRENIEAIRARIAGAASRAGRDATEINLEAVTKTKPAHAVQTAVDAGISIIGENRVQELLEKLPEIDLKGAAFHIIGHLQTNKVKSIIDKVDMIESLDSIKLATEIDKCAGRCGKKMKVLIEVNIGREPSKSGVFGEDLPEFYESLARFENIEVRGLMSVPPKCENIDILRSYFRQMRKLFIDIKNKKSDNNNIEFLSMGMSSDFETAIEEGANIVRIGSAIFGQRHYTEI